MTGLILQQYSLTLLVELARIENENCIETPKTHCNKTIRIPQVPIDLKIKSQIHHQYQVLWKINDAYLTTGGGKDKLVKSTRMKLQLFFSLPKI